MVGSVLQGPFDLVCRIPIDANPFEASSPPSSPCSFVDSSPPSSPLNDTLDLGATDDIPEILIAQDRLDVTASGDASPSSFRRCDVKGKGRFFADIETSPAHPFAASTRATKRPPSYSKDAQRPKRRRSKNEADFHLDVFGIPLRERIQERNEYLQSTIPKFSLPEDVEISVPVSRPGQSSQSTSRDTENDLWEETIAEAVDSADPKIDLSGHNLTYIPSKIEDLSKIVVIPDKAKKRRDLTRRTCSKSTNSLVFGASSLGGPEDEIHLFLARNSISSLPNELFNLNALVVLSLRANNLTEIPPLIGQLRNLRELNVANNKLRYLPSEIMSLNLSSLALDPNPFEENPYAMSEPSRDRWFGPIRREHIIVPLVEIVLRFLLAPSSDLSGLRDPTAGALGARRQEMVLEHFYDLPILSEYMKSPLLREILSSCVPGSITQSLHTTPSSSPESSQSSASNSRQRPCISTCPSSRHLDLGGRWRRPVFVMHAETRFSWEKHIAGQRVGGGTGIPVLWRGCSANCLEYLERSDTKVGPRAEEDWSIRMDVHDTRRSGCNLASDNNIAASSLSSLSEQPSRDEFKVYGATDVDLD